MNASTSVSAMFDAAFQGLSAPGAAPTFSGNLPTVALPTAPVMGSSSGSMPAAPPSSSSKRSILKVTVIILATLGIIAGLFLVLKKRNSSSSQTLSKKSKRHANKKKMSKPADDDNNSDSDDDNASNDSDTEPSKQNLTTFAPLDLPPVGFPPAVTHRVPVSAPPPMTQQLPPATNIRNSRGTRASEQLQDFPPPNIDVGLGSGSPIRPPSTAATLPPNPPTDANFNPL